MAQPKSRAIAAAADDGPAGAPVEAERSVISNRRLWIRGEALSAPHGLNLKL